MNTGEGIFIQLSEILTVQHKSNLTGIHAAYLVIFTAQMLFLAHQITELGTSTLKESNVPSRTQLKFMNSPDSILKTSQELLQLIVNCNIMPRTTL